LKSDSFLDDLSLLNRKDNDLPENQRRGSAKMEHDLLLWHSTNNLRPKISDSYLEAKTWVATIDHRLILFDKSKKTKIPICLDPPKIIELLQIWLPRTEFLSQQLLNIIRLPPYDSTIARETAEATRRILSVLSRYSTSSELSEETIHAILLNNKLRNSILLVKNEEEEIAVIHDELLTLVENSKQRLKEIEDDKDKFKADSKEKDTEIKKLAKAQEEQNKIIISMKDKLNNLDQTRNELNLDIVNINKNKSDIEQNSLQKDLIIKQQQNWEEQWELISQQWYYFPLTVVIFVIGLYFGFPWIRAAIRNTSFENFDFKTVASLIAIVGPIITLFTSEKIKNSFKWIFFRKRFKEKLRSEFDSN
jgi:hypothetical protein